jgi:uncharacterized protein
MNDVTVERDVMVEMRDGVRLATDIYRPIRNGRPIDEPLPVIMERTPYGKSEPSRSEIDVNDRSPRPRSEVARFFASNEYVVIYQDCRGRWGSEGTFTKYVNEGEDGYDTLAWIVEQPWCDGRIATMGLSYAAHVQAAAASLGAPGIACMFLDSGGFSNAYQGGIRQGGAFELKQATWAHKQALLSAEIQNDPVRKKAMEAEDLHAWFARMPWKKGQSPLRWAPEYEAYMFDQWRHGVFDDYWRRPGLCAEAYYDTFPDVPMVFMSSWYDAYVRTTVDNFVGLKNSKTAPMRLIMGHWTHGNRSDRGNGDVDFGDRATLDGQLAGNYLELRLAWFDHCLKGGVADKNEKPVHLFIMGGGSGRRTADGLLDHGGTWRHEDDWPLPDTQFTKFYVADDGSLSPDAPTCGNGAMAYNFDPRHPVPTIGGALTSGEPVFDRGAFDQRESERIFGCKPPYLPLASRPDILVFETEPLDKDVEITGPIEVCLWVSSDCLDTDFTAKLLDIYPPSKDYPQGFALGVTNGILRARYRDSWTEPSMMESGKVYQIKIEPFATSNVFKAGHRIRLDISSSNFPHFDVNPNTGAPEGTGQDYRIAHNTIQMSKDHPSHIVLPIIPARQSTEG